MEKKLQPNPELREVRHDEIRLEKGEVEKKKIQILESIPKEIIEKLNPEEREHLVHFIELKLDEHRKEKDPKKEEHKKDGPKKERPHHHTHNEHTMDHNVLEPLKDVQRIELMIHLCGNRHELIKLLNDINRVLLENSKENYHVNVKKLK